MTIDERKHLVRLRLRAARIVAECEQICRDTNAYNGMPQMANEVPFDCEWERVTAANTKAFIAQIDARLAEGK